jgi:beta-phosphoglucomutase-like phosphatase (HAD superfamily)
MPHPEPYLGAARLVSADPRDCVAIEDSPTGVRSATAAGVPTIAVPHIVPVPEIPGAVRLDSLQGVGAQDLLRLVSSMRTQEAEYRPPAVR